MALITELDDRTLVERHRSGDEHAFRRIVERHHRSLYANALRRLGDPVLAEDAVQEAFLRAFRNLDRFDGDYHLDAWLHRIVTNTCHDIGRRQGRDTRLFDRACTRVETESPAADEGLDATPRDELTDALDQLPESYREVLLLRFVDEMSYEDVALKAGISEQNARARVSRGRTMLKRLMSSTSALVVWAIPPLRRSQGQLTGSEAEVANQAASQVHALSGLTNVASTAAPSLQTAPGFSHLSSLAAQAGPTIAQALPTATSTGSTLGKAAVAVGIAASMAIPTGVAVDRVRDRAATDRSAASLQLDSDVPSTSAGPSAQAPASNPTSAPRTVEAQADGGFDAITETSAPTISTTAPTTSTTIAQQQPSTTTTTAPAPIVGGPVAPADPGEEQPAEETPPPAPAQVSTGALSVTYPGGRIDLTGPVTLAVGENRFAGHLEWRFRVADADAKKSDAPREIDPSDLVFRFDDDRVAKLLVAGEAVVTEHGATTIYELTLRFSLPNGADFGLADGGYITGRLEVDKDQGTLALEIPAAPAADGTADS